MIKLTGGIINACIFFEILYYFFYKEIFRELGISFTSGLLTEIKEETL